jgi:hypothetical protein
MQQGHAASFEPLFVELDPIARRNRTTDVAKDAAQEAKDHRRCG